MIRPVRDEEWFVVQELRRLDVKGLPDDVKFLRMLGVVSVLLPVGVYDVVKEVVGDRAVA